MNTNVDELLIVIVTIVATVFVMVVVIPRIESWIEWKKFLRNQQQPEEVSPAMKETRVKFAQKLLADPKAFTLSLSEEKCEVRWDLNEKDLNELREALAELRNHFQEEGMMTAMDEKILVALADQIEFFLSKHAALEDMAKNKAITDLLGG